MGRIIKVRKRNNISSDTIKAIMEGSDGLPNNSLIDLQNDAHASNLLIKLTEEQFIYIVNPPDYADEQIYVQILDIGQTELKD